MKKPRFVAAVATVLLAVGIGIAMTSPASASSTTPTNSGLKLSAHSVAGPVLTGLSVRPNSNPYGLELRNAWNACIGFQNGDTGDGAQARQEPCGGQPDQAFRESTVIGPDGNQHTQWVNSNAGSRCLDIAYGAGTVNGAYVMLWDCNSNLTQLWDWFGPKIGSGWNLRNYLGKCLGIDGGSNGAGLPAIIWDCDTWNDQIWRLT